MLFIISVIYHFICEEYLLKKKKKNIKLYNRTLIVCIESSDIKKIYFNKNFSNINILNIILDLAKKFFSKVKLKHLKRYTTLWYKYFFQIREGITISFLFSNKFFFSCMRK